MSSCVEGKELVGDRRVIVDGPSFDFEPGMRIQFAFAHTHADTQLGIDTRE
jgi:hypothetical protein